MTIKTVLFIIAVIVFFSFKNKSSNKEVTEPPKYQANWESLKQHKTPDWFLDAKFGIYCHWGPYSVPAHKTEWYSHWMYEKDHPIRKYHEKTYGPLNEFGYKDFIPMFTAEKFNPEEWAELFKKAGAKFAGPVTEHADGFAMWDSKLTKWNAAKMGPKRDVVGELAKAIRANDMIFVATFHHQWKYSWYPTWDKKTDAFDPKYEDLYGPKVPPGIFAFSKEKTDPLPDKKFNDEWFAKVKEVVEAYHPDLMYFDSKMFILTEEVRKKMACHFYNHANKNDQDVVLTYKQKDLAEGSAVLDLERARMSEKKDFPWLTDDSIDWGSWCHVSNPDYKSTNRLIDFLVDVISKNGCVLLNVTPTAAGEIPQPVKERLLEMGEWLKINGEAVYGTRPWKVFGEGPAKVVEGHLNERENADNTEKDIRFTTKGNNLYAMVLDIPSEDVLITSLGENAGLLEKQIKNIELVGSKEKIEWEHMGEYLKITKPKEETCNYCVVFRLTF
ncbi:MAG: alpha-L-fucosidase [Draconibacterium sp.]|nr:alpha-L-fucosidase [Draconibacterium sp.]